MSAKVNLTEELAIKLARGERDFAGDLVYWEDLSESTRKDYLKDAEYYLTIAKIQMLAKHRAKAFYTLQGSFVVLEYDMREEQKEMEEALK